MIPSILLVQEGDRIAQLILERIMTPEVLEVDVSSYFSFPFPSPLRFPLSTIL